MARTKKNKKRSQGESYVQGDAPSTENQEPTLLSEKFEKSQAPENLAKETQTQTDEDITTTTTESQEFASFYLRKITMELEDDLDKIRSSGDFKQSSLPVLIEALRQGEIIFSEEEKRQVMGNGF